mmetsp:Transcript_38498/g.70496  ORF Transcript_38498/g.70496 Transcript_38498/m.70496 type:complete len:207 (-) Transcript_38498:1016-1636(-)
MNGPETRVRRGPRVHRVAHERRLVARDLAARQRHELGAQVLPSVRRPRRVVDVRLAVPQDVVDVLQLPGVEVVAGARAVFHGGVGGAAVGAAHNPSTPEVLEDAEPLQTQSFRVVGVHVPRCEKRFPVGVRHPPHERVNGAVRVGLRVFGEPNDVAHVHRHVELAAARAPLVGRGVAKGEVGAKEALVVGHVPGRAHEAVRVGGAH